MLHVLFLVCSIETLPCSHVPLVILFVYTFDSVHTSRVDEFHRCYEHFQGIPGPGVFRRPLFMRFVEDQRHHGSKSSNDIVLFLSSIASTSYLLNRSISAMVVHLLLTSSRVVESGVVARRHYRKSGSFCAVSLRGVGSIYIEPIASGWGRISHQMLSTDTHPRDYAYNYVHRNITFHHDTR
ncbi:hypothetical protein SPBRAN_575 [uncultured Candidatus Thioglobus sp.]|nr:hypothetical protein SPBRAN_575 [uncultured Candidatus Thioglobus sp.]